MVFKFNYVLYYFMCYYFYKIYEHLKLTFFLLDLYVFYIYLCKLNSLFKYLKILKNIKFEFIEVFLDFQRIVFFYIYTNKNNY